MRALEASWWLASRAAGITAYLLLSLTVAGGLIMAMRVAPLRLRTAIRLAHERVALLAIGFLVAHGLLLLGDEGFGASLADILIPFHVTYRPVWTGLGVLAGYLTIALSLTFYARKRLGAKRWRNAHRFIPLAWAMGAMHVLGAGTDAGSLWLLAPTLGTIGAGCWLLAERWLIPRKAPARPKARKRPSAWAQSPR